MSHSHQLPDIDLEINDDDIVSDIKPVLIPIGPRLSVSTTHSNSLQHKKATTTNHGTRELSGSFFSETKPQTEMEKTPSFISYDIPNTQNVSQELKSLLDKCNDIRSPLLSLSTASSSHENQSLSHISEPALSQSASNGPLSSRTDLSTPQSALAGQETMSVSSNINMPPSTSDNQSNKNNNNKIIQQSSLDKSKHPNIFVLPISEKSYPSYDQLTRFNDDINILLRSKRDKDINSVKKTGNSDMSSSVKETDAKRTGTDPELDNITTTLDVTPPSPLSLPDTIHSPMSSHTDKQNIDILPSNTDNTTIYDIKLPDNYDILLKTNINDIIDSNLLRHGLLLTTEINHIIRNIDNMTNNIQSSLLLHDNNHIITHQTSETSRNDNSSISSHLHPPHPITSLSPLSGNSNDNDDSISSNLDQSHDEYQHESHRHDDVNTTSSSAHSNKKHKYDPNKVISVTESLKHLTSCISALDMQHNENITHFMTSTKNILLTWNNATNGINTYILYIKDLLSYYNNIITPLIENYKNIINEINSNITRIDNIITNLNYIIQQLTICIDNIMKLDKIIILRHQEIKTMKQTQNLWDQLYRYPTSLDEYKQHIKDISSIMSQLGLKTSTTSQRQSTGNSGLKPSLDTSSSFSSQKSIDITSLSPSHSLQTREQQQRANKRHIPLFTTLPSHLQSSICSYLSLSEIGTMRLVSHSFNYTLSQPYIDKTMLLSSYNTTRQTIIQQRNENKALTELLSSQNECMMNVPACELKQPPFLTQQQIAAAAAAATATTATSSSSHQQPAPQMLTSSSSSTSQSYNPSFVIELLEYTLDTLLNRVQHVQNENDEILITLRATDNVVKFLQDEQLTPLSLEYQQLSDRLLYIQSQLNNIHDNKYILNNNIANIDADILSIKEAQERLNISTQHTKNALQQQIILLQDLQQANNGTTTTIGSGGSSDSNSGLGSFSGTNNNTNNNGRNENNTNNNGRNENNNNTININDRDNALINNLKLEKRHLIRTVKDNRIKLDHITKYNNNIIQKLKDMGIDVPDIDNMSNYITNIPVLKLQ